VEVRSVGLLFKDGVDSLQGRVFFFGSPGFAESVGVGCVEVGRRSLAVGGKWLLVAGVPRWNLGQIENILRFFGERDLLSLFHFMFNKEGGNG